MTTCPACHSEITPLTVSSGGMHFAHGEVSDDYTERDICPLCFAELPEPEPEPVAPSDPADIPF